MELDNVVTCSKRLLSAVESNNTMFEMFVSIIRSKNSYQYSANFCICCTDNLTTHDRKRPKIKPVVSDKVPKKERF